MISGEEQPGEIRRALLTASRLNEFTGRACLCARMYVCVCVWGGGDECAIRNGLILYYSWIVVPSSVTNHLEKCKVSQFIGF